MPDVQSMSFTNAPDNNTEKCRCGSEFSEHWDFTFAGKTRIMCPEAQSAIVEIMSEMQFVAVPDDITRSEGRAEMRGYERV